MSEPWAQEEQGTSAGRKHVVIGLVSDPEAAPAQLAEQLEDDLLEPLAEQLGDDVTWELRVAYERLPPDQGGEGFVLDFGHDRMRRHGWDLVICITDLPLRTGRRPIIAEVSVARCAGVVSLPAFGVMSLRTRARRVVVQIIAEILGRGAEPVNNEQSGGASPEPRINRLRGRFERIEVDQQNIDIRIVASRGRQRLLLGMIRDNRPWRVIFGLTGATAGALAFSAFYLVNSSLWELSNALGPLRLAVATLCSLALLVSWLIIRHRLWESPRYANLPHESDEVRMFNISTVVTLSVGMLFMYVGLFVLVFGAALLVLDAEVLSSYIDDSGVAAHANIAWLATSAAGIAGALGASFDSEARVRQAAYSYRERERRAQRQEQQQGAQAYVEPTPDESDLDAQMSTRDR